MSDCASSSSSPAPQIKYDVFVSFRGADIRQGFLSHLIKALSGKQVFFFVDDQLERGDGISQALLGAIERSSISLIIFSEDYASSHWCLEELVKIVGCREKGGQIVLPVFYKVDPSDVRHQKGTYGNAFAEHEKKYSLITMKTWRTALEKSAKLSGFHSSNFRNEAQLVEEIIKWLSMRLKAMDRVKSKGLIGINKPIAHLESLLCQESEDVRVIGIWGMGGIGKTTIAEEVFNRICFEYEGCCFLANVREESGRHGIISLKIKLFSTLLHEDLKIDTQHGLPSYVERRLGRTKVLIVVDDVNDSDQLESLVGGHDWFGSGSRIIVTSRDKQVLANEVDDIYKVKVLDFSEALQLFNLNAFKQSHLEVEYSELSKRVVNYAKGIPLVLKVLGLLLCGKDKEVWESQLEKLKKMPSKRVHQIMKLSYDDLDREEQKIFLDLACFFNGLNMEVGYIKILLKDRQYSVAADLERLTDKALITISEDNAVSVHDIIQEMAWEIVRQESIEDPAKRSRLWDPDDIYQILKNNKGTEAIRSITLCLPAIKKLDLSPRVFAKMRKVQFLNFYHEDFSYQARLRLPQGLLSFPTELRYLRWMDFPQKSLPKNFSAEKLVILDLSYSQVQKLWHGVQNLQNLRVVRLDYSKFLMELPDFSKAKNLEQLHIYECSRLNRVHPSVFSLDKLKRLSLRGCTSLTSLRSDNHLSSLRCLILSGCKLLREFSVTSENMIELNLNDTSINKLPSSIGRQSKLATLQLGRTYIESLPASIKHLTRLQLLDVRFCRKLRTLPELPSSLDRLIAEFCTSLKTVLFPSIAEQLRGNWRLVNFWNCWKLDEQSLRAIGLNAQISVMRFAYQHLSAAPENVGDRRGGQYVYPGSSVPEWLEHKTTKDYLTIDLSSSAPRSPLLGFIFCFIVPKDLPSPGSIFMFEFIITISDDERGGVIRMFPIPMGKLASDQVCVMYDKECSRYVTSRAQNQSRFEIKVKGAILPVEDQEDMVVVELKGLGVSPISASGYHNFVQQMELGDKTNGKWVVSS